ncbi:MAG TPA: zinc ribbon domain-containing protein [Longimicrobiaceae bacterium]|nr:zinc ribbon domain-containing protein [Longimicrobiaceae bacterium]
MDLLDALREHLLVARAQDPDERPLTIGDVYQRLVPYRTIRGELGVLEFAAYEHALLRLLAGEGRALEVLDDKAREEIQRELASVNPILGIYRDYADAPVAVVNGGEPRTDPLHAAPGPDPSSLEQAPPVAAAPRTRKRARPAKPPPAVELPRAPEQPPAPEAGEPLPASAGQSCRECGEVLPPVEGLRFCPFCGVPRGPAPCAECGTLLDGEWTFCVRCGTRRP